MLMRIVWLSCALALVCVNSANLFGQLTATATLQGTVTDKSGAVIPAAEIRVTNKETGETRTDQTNGTGNYAFNLLPAGHYDVRVSVKGFTIGVFANVELF